MSTLAFAALRPVTASRGSLRHTTPVLRSAALAPAGLPQNLPAPSAAPRTPRTPLLTKEAQR